MNEIFRRGSVRSYSSRSVDDCTIERLLLAAAAAPSAANQQPWEFFVVSDAQVRSALSECSPYASCAAAAPAVIVLCSRRSSPHVKYILCDMAAAAENILLEAVHLGLGAVWLGIAPDPARMERVRKVLSIPESLEPFALIPVGYPAAPPMPHAPDLTGRVHYI